jgi:hypothetical protein
MLTHENNTSNSRDWDIFWDATGANTLAVDNFTSGTFGTGRIWEYEFNATASTMAVDFLQGTGTFGDQNPILQGVVLSLIAAVPEPTSIAIWSLLGLSLFGFGYFRLWRK